MVKEFTDLQGIVGGLYAKVQGEPEPVWRAIYDHYKPLSMEGEIPVHRRRPDSESGRQVGHAGLLLQRRPDPQRLPRPLRPAPRRARRRPYHRRRQGQVQLSERLERPCANSCATASNITSATSAASPTTKSAPAWPPVWTDLIDLEARLQRVQGHPPHARFRTHRGQLQAHQEHSEAGGLL